MGNTSIQEPRRGLLLVDTTLLKHLCQPVEDEYYLESQTKQTWWIDSLSALAAQGFQVVIPEMVAYEAVRMCADDKRSEEEIIASCESETVKRLRKPILDFLSEVRRGAHPGISIARTPDNAHSDAAGYMRKIHQAMQLQNDTRAAQLQSHEREFYGHGYGEMAIEDAINNLHKDSTRTVFVLSSDNDAMDSLRHARPDLIIGQVNSKGYIKGLYASKLCKTIGVDPDYSSPANDQDYELRVQKRARKEILLGEQLPPLPERGPKEIAIENAHKIVNEMVMFTGGTIISHRIIDEISYPGFERKQHKKGLRSDGSPAPLDFSQTLQAITMGEAAVRASIVAPTKGASVERM